MVLISDFHQFEVSVALEISADALNYGNLLVLI